MGLSVKAINEGMNAQSWKSCLNSLEIARLKQAK